MSSAVVEAGTESDEPEDEQGFWSRKMKSFLWLAAIVAVLVAAGAWYVRTHWDSWFTKALLESFEEMDADKSGFIDENEFYAGVLLLYLKMASCHAKVTVEPPDRQVVAQLLAMADLDHSGVLSFDEFERAVQIISKQMLGRVSVQLVFLAACPVLASPLVRWASRQSHSIHSKVKDHLNTSAGWTSLSSKLKPMASTISGAFRCLPHMPGSLPDMAVAGLLMLMVPKVFNFMDKYLVSSGHLLPRPF